MKFLQNVVRIKAAVLPAFAGWAGLTVYFFYKQFLPLFWFRFWHAVLVIFFFSLVSLVYYKFFDRYSLTTLLMIFIVTFTIADVILLFLSPIYATNFSALDFILTYALMVATVSVTYSIYHKTWRKKNTRHE